MPTLTKSKAKFVIKDNLPDKPSALIRVAIKDLTRIEKMSDKYHIDMGVFHELNGKCSVCLGGSALLSCGITHKMRVLLDHGYEDSHWVYIGKDKLSNDELEEKVEQKDPDMILIPTSVINKVYAIDCFRQGDIDGAYNNLEIDKPSIIGSEYDICEYRANKQRFKDTLLMVANILEAAGQ